MQPRCDSFVGLVTWEMRDGAEEAWSRQRRSVPQSTGGDDRHGSPAGEAGGADRLVALRRGVRAVLHPKGPTGIADAADGGAAPAQTHGGAVGRSGLRQVDGEPVLPVLLRRAVLPPQAGVRPLVDDPLAGPDRGRAARAAAGRDAQRRHAHRGDDTGGMRAGDGGYHRSDQGGRASHRQSTAWRKATASSCACRSCASVAAPGATSRG